jgi:hypothetical protein
VKEEESKEEEKEKEDLFSMSNTQDHNEGWASNIETGKKDEEEDEDFEDF